ncbi:hypothetical protein [Streptomyces iranensis]|uniref:Uncharacterized protein n=1 Tax=Streptomyces iranensis TaxID=576784 RepID=A0A061A5P1_9ACTN|nr:hypothetical protein [Streptomyces iranensis]CDR18130.1 predicted protein [Streptomyces iranensis]
MTTSNSRPCSRFAVSTATPGGPGPPVRASADQASPGAVGDADGVQGSAALVALAGGDRTAFQQPVG